MWGSVGDVHANFCCRWHRQIWEGHSRCIGRIGRSGDAFGCWEEASGVWGGLFGSVSITLWLIYEIAVYFSAFKTHKNMIDHLLLVGFWPFQCDSLLFYQWSIVGMQEAVSGATTEGERAPDGFGDGGANFLVLLMSVALGKATVYEWANRHVGWWLWVLARGCQRFGVNWLCDGWAVKMYCFGRHGCDVCFVSRWEKWNCNCLILYKYREISKEQLSTVKYC